MTALLMWAALLSPPTSAPTLEIPAAASPLHEIKPRKNGALRFKLLAERAPALEIGGARLRLVSAVEGPEPVVEVEIVVGEARRVVEMEPRAPTALPHGELRLRYLIDGEAAPGRREAIAAFELRPR